MLGLAWLAKCHPPVHSSSYVGQPLGRIGLGTPNVQHSSNISRIRQAPLTAKYQPVVSFRMGSRQRLDPHSRSMQHERRMGRVGLEAKIGACLAAVGLLWAKLRVTSCYSEWVPS